jgi:N-acetylneuraminic acid mutarotase
MVVWGGGNSNSFTLNTGGKYNPNTDVWTATSITNAPDARTGHTVVWTGSEMIVWGGFVFVSDGFDDPLAYVNTGGRYNPGTDSWTATSTANAPDGRWAHTAVWSGTEMIVWGGSFHDTDKHYVNTGGRYNPSTDGWTATSTSNAPSARGGHAAVWTGSEMIV